MVRLFIAMSFQRLIKKKNSFILNACKSGMKNLKEILFLMLSYNGGPKFKIKGKHLSKLECKYGLKVKVKGSYLMLSCLV